MNDIERIVATDTRLARIVHLLSATPADIPGLWNVPGFPELTSGQLLDIGIRAHLERQAHAD